MATRTPKYQLILHEATDGISRAAINENTTKTEAALDAIQQNISSVQQNLNSADVASRFTPIEGVSGLQAVKIGRLVMLTFNFTPNQIWTTAITGDQSVRPRQALSGACSLVAGSDASKSVFVSMAADGRVTILAPQPFDNNVRFSFTYISLT